MTPIKKSNLDITIISFQQFNTFEMYARQLFFNEVINLPIATANVQNFLLVPSEESEVGSKTLC